MTRSVHRAGWASVAVLALVLSSGPLQAQRPSAPAVAQQHFRQGQRLYREGSFERALEHFRVSLDAYDSPNARLYVARCLRELDRLPQAVLEYELASSAAADLASYSPRYARTRDAAREELQQLEHRIGRLTVEVRPRREGLELTIGALEVGGESVAIPLPVEPGTVHVRAESPGGRVVEQTIEIAAGEQREITLRLGPADPAAGAAATSSTSSPPGAALEPADRGAEPGARDVSSSAPPQPASPDGGRVLRSFGWTGVAVGAASLVVGGTFAWLADARYDDLLDACDGGVCPPSRQSDVAQGRRFERVSWSMLGTGLGVLAAGAVMVLLGSSDGEPSGAAAPLSLQADGAAVRLPLR